MTAPYAERQLDFTFTFGGGSFGESAGTTLNYKKMRATAEIEFASQSPVNGLFRLFGMNLNHINQLTKAGLHWEGRNDSIKVDAGDDQSGMTTIFDGQIFTAYPDFNSQPNVSFVVVSMSSRLLQLKPVSPNTFEGVTDAAEALRVIVKPAGLTLENNGVDVKLRSPYFPGTTWDQVQSLCRAADCNFFHDKVKNILAIWPRNGSRSGEAVLIGPETGMIGYPQFERMFCKVRTLFAPTVEVGKDIQVRSQLNAANGKWHAIAVSHNLAAQLPLGPWETIIMGARTGGG
jgi:hypothetical protein